MSESQAEKQDGQEEGDVNSNIIYALDDAPIGDIVTEMVEKQISSILVHDINKLIVGIVTERDIVRKFTLVDVEDKMDRPISTLMSRDVKFVSLEGMHDQIVDYHLKYRIRHFPILNGKEPKVDNIVGLISITDFLRDFILGDKLEKKDKSAETEPERIPLGVLSTIANYEQYRKIFSEMLFKVESVEDINDFAKKQEHPDFGPLIFDLDGFTPEELRKIIPLVRKYRGRTCYATSNHQLLVPFRRGLNRSVQAIALKPIDISYFNWFLSQPPDT